MPRHKHADPPVKILVSLPSSLVAKLDLLLIDPVRGKPKYAQRSRLIRRLLREYVEQRTGTTSSPQHEIQEEEEELDDTGDTDETPTTENSEEEPSYGTQS